MCGSAKKARLCLKTICLNLVADPNFEKADIAHDLKTLKWPPDQPQQRQKHA